MGVQLMKDLIKIESKIIGEENTNSVNARDLHKTLEIQKDFSTWINSQIKSLGLEENMDYITFAQKSENGRNLKEYIITIDTAKHISMASRTAKGKEVRNYFIEIEKSYNNNSLDSNKLKELTARIGGLTYANNQFKRQIKDLKAAQKEQLKLPHKSFDDNMEDIINQTMQELNRDTKKWDFLQNRANYFTKYVAALRSTGDEQQKYMISEIDRYRSDSIKAQKEVEIVKNKLENLQKVVDDYTNISNMMLRTRYAS